MHWKSPISAASVTSLCGRCVHATFKESLGLKPGCWGTLQNEIPCFRMRGTALCCHVPWGGESVSSDKLEAPFLQMLWGSWGAGNGAGCLLESPAANMNCQEEKDAKGLSVACITKHPAWRHSYTSLQKTPDRFHRCPHTESVALATNLGCTKIYLILIIAPNP